MKTGPHVFFICKKASISTVKNRIHPYWSHCTRTGSWLSIDFWIFSKWWGHASHYFALHSGLSFSKFKEVYYIHNKCICLLFSHIPNHLIELNLNFSDSSILLMMMTMVHPVFRMIFMKKKMNEEDKRIHLLSIGPDHEHVNCELYLKL